MTAKAFLMGRLLATLTLLVLVPLAIGYALKAHHDTTTRNTTSTCGGYLPFEGVPGGTIDGKNKVFTLTNAGKPLGVAPAQLLMWRNFPLVPGVGYTISGDTITFTNAPQPASGSMPADTIFAQGLVRQ